jgi:hypothetical protein
LPVRCPTCHCTALAYAFSLASSRHTHPHSHNVGLSLSLLLPPPLRRPGSQRRRQPRTPDSDGNVARRPASMHGAPAASRSPVSGGKRPPSLSRPASVADADVAQGAAATAAAPADASADAGGGTRRAIQRSNSLQGFSLLDKDAEAAYTDAARKAALTKAEEEDAKKREEEEAMTQARIREKSRAERRVNSLRRRSVNSASSSVSPDAPTNGTLAGATSTPSLSASTKERTPAVATTTTAAPEGGVTMRPKKSLTSTDIEEFNLVLKKTDGGGLGLSLQETAAGAISTVRTECRFVICGHQNQTRALTPSRTQSMPQPTPAINVHCGIGTPTLPRAHSQQSTLQPAPSTIPSLRASAQTSVRAQTTPQK